jgi:fatty acid synthase
MDSLMAAELGQVLSTRKNILIPAKSYAQLTFQKLAELDQGDGTLEESAKQDNLPKARKLLKLKKISEGTVFKMNSICTSHDILFLVHPMDGTMQTLETLAANLDVHVYGIECGKGAPLESVETLATFYLKQVQEIQPKGPYKIAGYSFGACVAFEMALQLERQNEELSLLLLLDGSPKWKDVIQNMQEGNTNVEEFENLVLFSYLQQYIADVGVSVLTDLSKIPNLEAKWKFMAKILSASFPELSLVDITDLMMSYMARMGCGKVYEANGKVKARTVLIRSLKGGLDSAIAHDYGLSDVCEDRVEIFGVDGNHACFYERPLELGIPAIVNDVLRCA